MTTSYGYDPVYVWVVGALLSLGLASGLMYAGIQSGPALGGVALVNIALAAAHRAELFTVEEEEELAEEEEE